MDPIRMMPCVCALLIAPLALSASTAPAQQGAAGQPPAAQAAPAAELAGLWTATRRFGPDARGRLLIERTGDTWVADMAGRVVPVRAEAGVLAFELPGDRGAFRGRLDGDVIRGNWTRPGTALYSSRFASPVVLRGDGRGRWAGLVQPGQDEFTFYLLVQPQPDGSLAAMLRNPERDIGTRLAVRHIVREGDRVRLTGGRPGAAETTVVSGAWDAESGTITLPLRGGSYDFTRDGDDSHFYPRGRDPARYVWRAPPALDDGWPVGTLDEAAIDRPAIERLVQGILETRMDSADAPQIHAILVARRGRLVLEEYFHGEGRDRLHDTRSAAKSVTSIAIGAAIQAGLPLSLSSPVYQMMNGGAFPDGLDPGKRAMTLEHLLTMSSGYHCDDSDETAPGNEDGMQEQTAEPDWLRFTLAVPLVTPPGENSVYCSASPNLALGMLERVTGESPVVAFDRLVAGPMRFGNYSWFLDPAGHPYGGGGMQLLPRDFLKIGQLMLNGGTWEGRRILSRDFAARAASGQYNLRNVRYGYLWWVEDYPYKDRTVRSFSARGAGGNLVVVIPELDLVVAIMAGNYVSRIQLTYTGGIVPRLLLPAVRERGDDPSAPVRDREFVSPYGRSADGSRVRTGN